MRRDVSRRDAARRVLITFASMLQEFALFVSVEILCDKIYLTNVCFFKWVNLEYLIHLNLNNAGKFGVLSIITELFWFNSWWILDEDTNFPI